MRQILLASAVALGLSAVASPAFAGDVRLYARHEVADYTAWRKGYDQFDAKRHSLGVTADAVYQSVDDPNNVTVWHDFTSTQAAKSFAASPELKAAMKNAGVTSKPQIWFVHKSAK